MGIFLSSLLCILSYQRLVKDKKLSYRHICVTFYPVWLTVFHLNFLYYEKNLPINVPNTPKIWYETITSQPLLLVKFVFLTVWPQETVFHVTVTSVLRTEQSNFKVERIIHFTVNQTIRLFRQNWSRPKSAVKLMTHELHRVVEK